jgi:hypothetical protein
MEFGLIPPEHWVQPDSIDEVKATASRNKLMEDNVIYGGSVSYRNMCRYNSGVRRDYQWQALGSFRLMEYSFSTVLLQASSSVKIQVVLAHRVRELHFVTIFFIFNIYFSL